MPIGTARMAHLCLPNSELHVGLHWENTDALQRAISDPTRPPMLLYPSDGEAVAELPVGQPITLIAVDGTWALTKKMVRLNPTLARLPRVGFVPDKPSEYRIRREPKAYCVSTIEALMLALGQLEAEPARFQALLTPFRAMVDRQIQLREEHRSGVSRHPKRSRQLGQRIPDAFRERSDDVVCVVGEANAWPWHASEDRSRYPNELIQWVATRVTTGEVFEAIVRPCHPLAPNTTRHTALTCEQIEAGMTQAEFAQRWRLFRRDTDIVCSWGTHAWSLVATVADSLPSERYDLRKIIKDILKRNIGTLEDFTRAQLQSNGVTLGSGRAGVRLALLSQLAAALCRGSIPGY